MKEKKALLIIMLGFVLLLACAGLLYSRLSEKAAPEQMEVEVSYETETDMPAEEESAEELPMAPDIPLYDAEGNAVQLSDFFGKPIILNFWASWCPPCKGEMPDFHAVWKEQGEEIQFLMVNLTDGSRETVETAQAFIEEQGYEFPVYFDLDQRGLQDYQAYSIPTTYFLDAEGHAMARATGAIGLETLNEGIRLITE